MEENINVHKNNFDLSKDNLVKFLSTFSTNKLTVEPKNGQVLELAYIGDTIYDFFTRDLLLKKYFDRIKMNDLHKKNSTLVCAKTQSKIIEYLINENLLNEFEIDFYKHARNAHSNSKSKNSSIIDYRKATGFEALIGLWYLENDIDRLLEILKIIEKKILETI